MGKTKRKRLILIVGEGRETEYNYFVGFRNAFAEQLAATATSVAVRRGKGGDASQIVKTAVTEAKRFDPNRKIGDRVFLLLDTEGPGRAPELPAAEKLAKDHGIEIIYSSPAFEYWLLCHFPNLPQKYFKNCEAVVAELENEKKWKTVRNAGYDKADQDIFDRIVDRLSLARSAALALDRQHIKTTGAARKTNPSTQVYELIARLVGVKTGDRCPIAGAWSLVADSKVVIQLQQGDPVPEHADAPAHWRL